jgi:hypothetical protein
MSDELPPERVDLWLLDALTEATEGLEILSSMASEQPTIIRLDAAASRLTKAAERVPARNSHPG